ncbi:MAG: M14 family metallopeptidase [Imperialibacter sp.]
MKRSTFLFLTALLCQQAFGQQNEFLAKVETAYDAFAEKSIFLRRFKHSDVEPLLLNLRDKKGFSVTKAGESIEGRSIYLVKAGTGPVKVLLWSQMHGDETTATRVLLDLFNFLSDKSTFAKEKEALLKGVTLYFIPMLNPDGAEQFQRRNALGIDINRDAVRLQSPEAQLLKHVRDSLNPDFGFNLHDQNSATSAGSTGKPASLSFLAPAFNEAKDINASRKAALQVVVKLNNLVQNYMPGHTARYDDTFEPRAFGDNIQKWGTSTILIECGAYPNDPEKQVIRKVHFLALLGTLQSIADGSYKKLDSND